MEFLLFLFRAAVVVLVVGVVLWCAGLLDCFPCVGKVFAWRNPCLPGYHYVWSRDECV